MILTKLIGRQELNQTNYNAWSVVTLYASRDALQKPEQAIFDLFWERLGGMSLLDIGMGGGRTSHNLIDRCGEYLGVDYSQAMVDACKKRFPRHADRFLQGDVRSMPMFPDARFDLVLFSFNGLDAIPHADRLASFAEVRRILKPGGYFIFSSHNIRAIDTVSSEIDLFSDPVRFLGRAAFYARLYLLDNDLRSFRAKKHALVRDMPGFQHYYIRPEEQLRQLEDAGFGRVRTFDLEGTELDPEALRRINDLWLYYLCEREPRGQSVS